MAACITPERHTLSALAARGGETRRGRARSPRGGLGIVELWSQAIGEIDAGRIVAAAISVFVARLCDRFWASSPGGCLGCGTVGRVRRAPMGRASHGGSLCVLSASRLTGPHGPSREPLPRNSLGRCGALAGSRSPTTGTGDGLSGSGGW